VSLSTMSHLKTGIGTGIGKQLVRVVLFYRVETENPKKYGENIHRYSIDFLCTEVLHCKYSPASRMVAVLHCKKRLAFFSPPIGMSLTRHSLAGNNLIISGQGEFSK
jgi:hypothetical protein